MSGGQTANNTTRTGSKLRATWWSCSRLIITPGRQTLLVRRSPRRRVFIANLYCLTDLLQFRPPCEAQTIDIVSLRRIISRICSATFLKVCIDFYGLPADFVRATNRWMTDSRVLGGRSPQASRRFRAFERGSRRNSIAGVPAVAIWFGLTERSTPKFTKSENVVPRCVCGVDLFLLSKT